MLEAEGILNLGDWWEGLGKNNVTKLGKYFLIGRLFIESQNG